MSVAERGLASWRAAASRHRWLPDPRDLGALGPLRWLRGPHGRLAAARLKVEPPGSAARWVPSSDRERFSPQRVFLRPAWARHWRDPGGLLLLDLVGAGRRLGRATIRDLHVPGVERRWEVVAEPELQGGPPEQARALGALLRLARRNGVHELVSRSNMARWTGAGLDVVLASAEREPFGTYLIDLTRPPDALRAALHSEHRRVLRRSEAAGVVIVPSVEAAAFEALLDTTYGRGGRSHAFGPGYLRRLIEAPAVDLLAWSAWCEGALQAAVVVPFDNERAFFLHGASLPRPAPGATVALHWAVMRELSSRGVARYDLGGARRRTEDPRLRGIFRFKRRLGGIFEDCVRWRTRLRR